MHLKKKNLFLNIHFYNINIF